MKTTKLLAIIFTIFSFSCKQKLPDNYHMDKRYWDISDYSSAITQIKYITPKEEGLPRLSDPLTAPVFNKLVDKENVSVVLGDEQLGIKHRNELAQKYFNFSKDIINIYQVLDIQDKFVYPIELVKAIEFGLHTQLLYFKLGNDEIIKDAINPENADVKHVIVRNEQIVANNFNIYIEFLTNEDAFNDAALKEYSTLLLTYFPRLIKEFPSANYSEMKNNATQIREKVKSKEIKDALNYVVRVIYEKK